MVIQCSNNYFVMHRQAKTSDNVFMTPFSLVTYNDKKFCEFNKKLH